MRPGKMALGLKTATPACGPTSVPTRISVWFICRLKLRPRIIMAGTAVPSKQGYLYVFDRATGQPVWPIEERPVPQSDVPGEKTSATQPFPPDKLRYNRNFMKVPDDVIDFTPELRAQALEAIKRYRYAPNPFMPGSIADVNGRLGSIVSPTATNWPGN